MQLLVMLSPVVNSIARMVVLRAALDVYKLQNCLRDVYAITTQQIRTFNITVNYLIT